MDLYRGAANKTTEKFGAAALPHFGAGKGVLTRPECERVIHIAVRDEALDERVSGNDYGGLYSYVQLPQRQMVDIMAGSYRPLMRTRKESGRATAAPSEAERELDALKRDHEPLLEQLQRYA